MEKYISHFWENDEIYTLFQSLKEGILIKIYIYIYIENSKKNKNKHLLKIMRYIY